MKPLEKHNETLVYPGVYQPLYRYDELSKKKYLKKIEKDVPALNIIETTEDFRVEMAVPGASRESFFINADGNILSVCVIRKKSRLPLSENFKTHEFNFDCYDRKVVLPENTDTEFVSAEYQSGILRLHIPKVKNTGKQHHTSIAVY